MVIGHEMTHGFDNTGDFVTSLLIRCWCDCERVLALAAGVKVGVERGGGQGLVRARGYGRGVGGAESLWGRG